MVNDMWEVRLVQQIVANYFQDKLGWECVYSYNEKVLGADISMVHNLATQDEKLRQSRDILLPQMMYRDVNIHTE
jgi:hypothetical protein